MRSKHIGGVFSFLYNTKKSAKNTSQSLNIVEENVSSTVAERCILSSLHKRHSNKFINLTVRMQNSKGIS